MSVTVAVDAMGGDHGPAVTVPACLEFLEAAPHASVVLVGIREPLETALAKARPALRGRISIHPATEVVDMDEPPADALRKKKDSSMRVAINLVKDGTANACVSAGNTGALMAIARFVLKTLHGIDRPTVGLLNIGAEDIKGSDVVKETAELLKASSLNYFGNVEGDDIYRGTTDVVVCDGFVGNVMLKTSEGLAHMLYDFLKTEFTRNLLTRIAAAIVYPVLMSFKRRIDSRRYNGATLVGLKGVVVKSHGGADAFAFANALKRAAAEVEHGVLEKIAQRISEMPPMRPADDTSGPLRAHA